MEAGPTKFSQIPLNNPLTHPLTHSMTLARGRAAMGVKASGGWGAGVGQQIFLRIFSGSFARREVAGGGIRVGFAGPEFLQKRVLEFACADDGTPAEWIVDGEPLKG